MVNASRAVAARQEVSMTDQEWELQRRKEQESEVCPQCGCEHYTSHETEVTGIQTFYRSCEDCDHNWRFE
jgi:transposase-like protein